MINVFNETESMNERLLSKKSMTDSEMNPESPKELMKKWPEE